MKTTTSTTNKVGFSGITGEGLKGTITPILGGGTCMEGMGISMYALLTFRSALKMHIQGFRMGRGISAVAVGKSKYGLKGNAKRQLVAVEAEIDRINKEFGS